MIPLDRVLRIHQLLINEFGGANGLRDKNGLEAALMRPAATFDGEELYPGAIEKAAAIAESILINHPFLDGNKRISYVLMQLVLLENEKEIVATENDKYALIISISKGELNHQAICKWLEEHSKR